MPRSNDAPPRHSDTSLSSSRSSSPVSQNVHPTANDLRHRWAVRPGSYPSGTGVLRGGWGSRARVQRSGCGWVVVGSVPCAVAGECVDAARWLGGVGLVGRFRGLLGAGQRHTADTLTWWVAAIWPAVKPSVSASRSWLRVSGGGGSTGDTGGVEAPVDRRGRTPVRLGEVGPGTARPVLAGEERRGRCRAPGWQWGGARSRPGEATRRPLGDSHRSDGRCGAG